MSMLEKVGAWSFIVGVVIALFAGFVPVDPSITTSLLIVIGLIVGFLNVTDHETKTFLLAGVSLVIVSAFGGQSLATVPSIGNYLASVLNSVITVVVPAVIIVSLKTVYSLAQD